MAARKPVAGAERWAAMTAKPGGAEEFDIRYQAGVTPSMRLVDSDGVIYSILAVTSPGGLKRSLLILCALEGGGDGS
jgi:head-tail adaptor